MNLLDKAMDKGFWEQVRKKECFASILKKLRKEYEKMLREGDLKAHKYSEFKLFFTTGERKTYEKAYNVFRSRLDAACVLALVYPEDKTYIDDLMDTVYAICDEYTWCWPAHQGKLEINDNCHIDLLASMTASQLAQVYTVLEDRLDPLIKNRIKHEIKRRVIDPFLATEHYDWWEKNDSNWAAVCIDGIARSMMLLFPEGMTDQFEQRVLSTLETYLSGFDRNGVCLEGMGYWRYGVGHFVMCADMLCKFTNGRIDLFKREKVKHIASFYQKLFLSGDIGVSFSDGGGAMRYPVYLLHYLKNKYPDDVLVYGVEYSHWECTNVHSYTWYDDSIMQNPAPDDVSFEFFADEAQWMIKRTPSYGFAAKGGSNGDSHNHNDVGSFIFAKQGRHVFTDPGGGLYSRQYFDDATRYSFVECSSRGHSVPIIGDVCQSFGKQFAAKDVKYKNGVFSLDIAGAYECEGLSKLQRSFSFKEDSVAVTDSFEYTGDQTLIQRFSTRFEPQIASSGEIKVDCGGLGYDPKTATASITKEIDSKGNDLYFIDIILGKGVLSSTVIIY